MRGNKTKETGRIQDWEESFRLGQGTIHVLVDDRSYSSLLLKEN